MVQCSAFESKAFKTLSGKAPVGEGEIIQHVSSEDQCAVVCVSESCEDYSYDTTGRTCTLYHSSLQCISRYGEARIGVSSDVSMAAFTTLLALGKYIQV